MSGENLPGICGGFLGSLLAIVHLSAVSLEGILVTGFYGAIGATVGFLTQASLKWLFRKKGWRYN
jgi:hypothetical protein